MGTEGSLLRCGNVLTSLHHTHPGCDSCLKKHVIETPASKRRVSRVMLRSGGCSAVKQIAMLDSTDDRLMPWKFIRLGESVGRCAESDPEPKLRCHSCRNGCRSFGSHTFRAVVTTIIRIFVRSGASGHGSSGSSSDPAHQDTDLLDLRQIRQIRTRIRQIGRQFDANGCGPSDSYGECANKYADR